VKLFMNTQTWKSKGCGKVQFATQEGADKALNELSGTILNDRIVTIEQIGQSSNVNPNPNKKAREAPKPREDFTDDMPKQLPLSLFSENDSPKAKLQICYAAFEDLMANHDPVASGVSLILMIRKLIMEVNDVFGEDEASLKEWCAHLRTCQWFWDNQQIVKWQANKRRVNISKISPNTGAYIDAQQSRTNQVEQRKLEQTLMGKEIFEVPEAERAAPSPALSMRPKGQGKGKGGHASLGGVTAGYGGYGGYM